MTITQVTYARLFALPGYENERFEAVATVVDDDVAAAYAVARAVVEAQAAEWRAERQARNDRKTLIEDLRLTIFKAREVGHAIPQMKASDMTDQQLADKLAEIRRLLDAPLAHSVPLTHEIATMKD